MTKSTWDGVTRSTTLNEEANVVRQQLADAAKVYDWTTVLSILSENPHLINCTRPDGPSGFTVLHQAAHGGASADVIQQLIDLGAWRSLRTTEGERAVDIAQRRKHHQLVDLLTPQIQRDVPTETIQAIQQHFHAVIRGRCEHLIHEHNLRLPELEPLLEVYPTKMWFAVPGMYGGFSYSLIESEGSPALMSESWSRICGGSGQRHLIRAHGSVLLEEGFV